MSFPLRLESFSAANVFIEFFVPDAVAVRDAYQKGLVSFPYWSQVWPAAKALAKFLLDNPAYTEGKKVLELGAGLGLPSLVAARNATNVLCTDFVPEAVEVVNQSAAHLQLKNVKATMMDWRCLPQDLSADVLLLSDINYEPAAFGTLQKTVGDFLSKHTIVLLSTPQRLMAKEFVLPLLTHCKRQEELLVMHEGKGVATTVVVLAKD